MSLLQSVAFRMSAVIINPLDAGDVAAPQGGMPFDILSNWVLSHLANVDEHTPWLVLYTLSSVCMPTVSVADKPCLIGN